MPTASPGRLFVSFWDVCLDNLPPGTFRRCLISANDAKSLIDEARETNSLLGLSDDDLLAPYRQHERENHDALCRILKRDWDIDLSFKDFCSPSGSEADPLYTVNPLSIVQIRDQNRLLIITCNYSLDENNENASRRFHVAPGSIGFHLIEAIPTGGPPPAGTDGPDTLLGLMRDDADLLDQIVADAMRQRQIQSWRPDREDFAVLEAFAEQSGRSLNELLDEAVRLLLKQRAGRPPASGEGTGRGDI